jgi:tetratricopeptide (TPR) repeat protein
MRLRTTFLFFFLLAVARASSADPISELIEQGHFKRAEAAIRKQLQQNPNDALANCLMSKVDVAFARFDQAIAHAEKAVAADNNSGRYHAQLEDALGPRRATLRRACSKRCRWPAG